MTAVIHVRRTPAGQPAGKPAGHRLLAWLLAACALWYAPVHANERAQALIERAIDLTRSQGSIATISMHVHRPDWERTSQLVAWTRGREDALIRFTAPARDAGNATLKRAADMWTYAPRVNRVIRLPASLMSQSWAGSDFSYNDLARSDELLVHYTLALADGEPPAASAPSTAAAASAEDRVFTIDATPRPSAPVVWGRQQLRVRADGVIVEATWFDQDDVAVKRLQALTVEPLGGRTFATHIRMSDLTRPDHYTEVHYEDMKFDQELGDEQFTQFALRNSSQ